MRDSASGSRHAWAMLRWFKRPPPPAPLPTRREPLHAFIRRHLDPQTGFLPDSAMDLPDEDRRFPPGKPRWVAGGLDGALAHHASGGADDEKAARVAELLARIARTGDADAKRALGELLEADGVLGFLDAAIEKISAARVPTTPHLHPWLRELATTAPDRGPIKFAIALLGLIRAPDDGEIVLTLAKHEEFTLFAAVALGNALTRPEPTLYALARGVHGWGRIHLVERLADTDDPAIKRWLLVEGFRNRVMHEYLAHLCASAGGLHAALGAEPIAEELMRAADDLLAALIAGGPARDINDYDHAAVAIARYLQHARRAPRELRRFGVVQALREYLSRADWDPAARQDNGWTEPLRAECRAAAEAYLADPEWPALAAAGLASEDDEVFAAADRAARALGVDAWPAHWRRVQENPLEGGRWFGAVNLADAARLDALLALAEKSLPLGQIASGPGEELGFGPEFRAHGCLDFIVQALANFPGQGRRLLLTALRSPVVRNRHLAMQALEKWPTTPRDAEIDGALAAAQAAEPVAEVRQRIEKARAARGS